MLLIGRAVNVAVPLTLGGLVDLFEKQYGTGPQVPQTRSFWPYLFAYVGLRFLQGGGGLNALRDVSADTFSPEHGFLTVRAGFVGSCHAILRQRWAYSSLP